LAQGRPPTFQGRNIMGMNASEKTTGLSESSEYVKILDAVSLLVKSESIYEATSDRIRFLSFAVRMHLQNLVLKRIKITLTESGFSVEGETIEAVAQRRDFFRRLRYLNVRSVTLDRAAEPEHFLAFASTMNSYLRSMKTSLATPVDWSSLPDTIKVDESRFGHEADHLSLDDPSVVEKLRSLVQYFKSIQARLPDTEQVVVMDVIETLLDTLKELESSTTEEADTLIARILDRLPMTMISPISVEAEGIKQTRLPLKEVARKLWPLLGHGDELQDLMNDEAEDLPLFSEEEMVQPEFLKDVEIFLGECDAPDQLEPPDDRSFLDVLLWFMRDQSIAPVTECMTTHLLRLFEHESIGEAKPLVKEAVMDQIDRDGDVVALKPLLSRLVSKKEILDLLKDIDLSNQHRTARLGKIFRCAWPEVFPDLYQKLCSRHEEQQHAALATILRTISRNVILMTGKDMIRLDLIRQEGFQRWLRAIRIPEVLPLYEVMFSSYDEKLKNRAFQGVREYPFRDPAAFWLRAAEIPDEISTDYFTVLLGAEWEGVFDQQLFQEMYQKAVFSLQSDNENTVLLGLRALSFADVDKGAELLIHVYQKKRWGFLPTYSRKIRTAARSALFSMMCNKAVNWTLSLEDQPRDQSLKNQ